MNRLKKNVQACLFVGALCIGFGVHAASEQTLKQKVIAHFRVTQENSGPDISASGQVVAEPLGGDTEIVALIAGYRDVMWDSSKMSLWEDEDRLIIEQLIREEGIRELEGFYFRPEGEKKALQLVKMHLLESGNQDVYLNDYLFGRLLGYSQTDAEFYYYLQGFMSVTSIDIPPCYAQFSQEQKAAFEQYKNNVWPNSRMRECLKLDKKTASDWLDEHGAYSIEDIRDQIEALKAAGYKIRDIGIKFSVHFAHGPE